MDFPSLLIIWAPFSATWQLKVKNAAEIPLPLAAARFRQAESEPSEASDRNKRLITKIDAIL